MRQYRVAGTIIPGIAFILLGMWFLLPRLGVPTPGLAVLWPLFPVLGGIWFLASYVGGYRDPNNAFVGIAALLIGIVCFLFSLRVITDLGQWWPAFPIIGGLAFLAQWGTSDLQDSGPLWIGFLALLVGLVALPFSAGLVSDELGRRLARLWPIVLILVGTIALIQVLARADRN